MEDTVSGWVWLCACLHPCMCEEKKKPVLRKNFQCWTESGRLNPHKTKMLLKASERRKAKGSLWVCRSISMHKLNRIQRKLFLNLEQHIHPPKKRAKHMSFTPLKWGHHIWCASLVLFLCSKGDLFFFLNQLLGNWNQSWQKCHHHQRGSNEKKKERKERTEKKRKQKERKIR